MLILDCCRTFKYTSSKNVAKEDRGRSLAEQARSQTAIAHACEPNSTAIDGDGVHGGKRYSFKRNLECLSGRMGSNNLTHPHALYFILDIPPNCLEIIIILILAGMYTQFLLEYLTRSNLALRKMLDMVTKAVVEKSGGRQVPVCSHQQAPALHTHTHYI